MINRKEYAHELQTIFQQEPVILSIPYRRFLSGGFGELTHPELAHGELVLTDIETRIASEIQQQLQHQDVIRFVDFGSMLALSTTVLAWKYQQEVMSGHLQIFAINKEPQFNPEAGIAEARRRIRLRSEYERLSRIVEASTNGNNDDLAEIIASFRPIIQTAEVDFLAHYYPLVQFISGIDTLNVPHVLGNREGYGAFDIGHEYFGGITHHVAPWVAFDKLIREINPVTGMFFCHIPPSLIINKSMNVTKLPDNDGDRDTYWVYSRAK